MRRVLIFTKPFVFVLFLVGVTVRSAESLSSAIPLGTSIKRANSKRANHGRSRLFQDALCHHDITSPFPPSGNGGYVRNLDVMHRNDLAVTITTLPLQRGNEMSTTLFRSSPHFFASYLQEEARALHSAGPDQFSCEAGLNSRIKHGTGR